MKIAKNDNGIDNESMKRYLQGIIELYAKNDKLSISSTSSDNNQ